MKIEIVLPYPGLPTTKGTIFEPDADSDVAFDPDAEDVTTEDLPESDDESAKDTSTDSGDDQQHKK